MGAGMVRPNPDLKKGTCFFFVLKFSCIKTKIKTKTKLRKKTTKTLVGYQG